jgi:putative ABC transport system permease protein
MSGAAWVPVQLRHAMRSLIRRPTLSLVALATLALGIGANTAIFSIINAVLLKPLPLAEPTRLVMVWRTAPSQGLSEGLVSYPDFKDWREQSLAFAGLGAWWTFPNGDVNVTGGTEPERVSVARITPGFFETLGVIPLHGRTFLPEESVVGNHRRAILSYGLWKRQFGGDPALVGRSVMVNGFPYEVVGIMPSGIRALGGSLGTDVDLWRPLVPEDNQTGGRDARKLRVVGRLRPGVTVRQAESELAGVAARLAQTWPETNRDAGVRLVALREQVVKDVRRGLIFLLAAVGIVLLVACVNVANLLLIKAASTRKQVAVQQALGASPLRLRLQVLTESLILGGTGAVLGLLVAFGSVKAVVAFGPRDIPLLADARIDGTVLVFTIAAALLTTVLFGMVPASQSAGSDATILLRQAGGRSRGVGEHRLMGLLTTSQISLAMMLLTGGGLLLRSFQALLRVDLGLDARRLLTFQVELPMATTYPTQPARDAFFANLLSRVEGLPGVGSATFANAPPIEEQASEQQLRLPGSGDDRIFHASFRIVAPGYFALLGIPVRKGREFQAGDGREAPLVAIASASLARSMWGEGNPLGARLALPFGGNAEVVGVTGDVRTGGLDGEPSRTIYLAAAQVTYNFMTMLVKTQGDPRVVVPAVRSLVHELDPNLPVHHVRTVNDLVAGSVARQQFQLVLLTAFSLLVFVLAVVGTYGVVSYTVSERTRELGIRMALGANARTIWRLVLGEGVRLALLGVVIGLVAAAALSRTLSRFVFGISVLDPTTFAVTAVLVSSAVLLATFLPAHRATRVDPVQVLREE